MSLMFDDTAGMEDSILSSFEDLNRRAKLYIIILGPDSSGGDLYRKRCEIRDNIIELGHAAHFCEDIFKSERLTSSGLNLTTGEHILLQKVDYIICLMDSPGAIGEVHDFAKDKRIARKMMICVDAKHKSGYSASGVIRIFEGYNGKVDWFKKRSDIRNCHLLGRVIDQIKKVAEGKQWEVAEGGLLS